MKRIYREFEISIRKDTGLCHVIRIDDNWELGSFERLKTVKETVEDAKILIDDYFETPDDYND